MLPNQYNNSHFLGYNPHFKLLLNEQQNPKSDSTLKNNEEQLNSVPAHEQKPSNLSQG